MRIAYLGQMADVARETSIAKKIRGQCVAWRAAGHEVCYFSLASTATVWPGMRPVPVDLCVRGGTFRRLVQSFQLVRRIKAWKPDAIYFRYAYHNPGLVGLFRKIPTVAEINSDDLAEYPLTLSRAKVIYHRLTRNRLLRTVTGFVAVTNELATRFAGFGKPCEVIANGIALADFPPLPCPEPGQPPRLVFMGSPGSPWHGLDRVAALARVLPDMPVDIIGRSSPDGTENPSPAIMCFHGILPRDRYEPLLSAATVAIGSLALYLNGMEEACPLKVREYLAFGLPVIGAYRDADIPEDADYFLRLPNSAASLEPHRDRIRSFIHSWQGRRVPRHCIAHLDSSGKEMRRLAFIQRMVDTRT